MAGDGHADLLPGQLLQLRRKPVGYRRVRHGLACRLEFLFAHGRLLAADRALRDRDDREALAVLRTLFDGLRDLFRGVRDLRDDDDVRARGDARVQRQPAGLVAHDLDDEHARVGKGGRMDGVDDLRGNVHRRLEAEGQLRPPQVVVDGLGQRDDVHAVLAQQVRSLVRTVAAENDQAVKSGLFHRFQHFIQLCLLAVLLGALHLLERLTRGAEDGAAERQNVRKVVRLHLMVVSLDQAAVAVADTVQRHAFAHLVIQCLCDTPERRVQSLTVAAARKHSDFHIHRPSPAGLPAVFFSPL